MKKEKVYLAGDLLNRGSVLLRQKEAKELRELGVNVVSVIENEKINNKKKQTIESNNTLAERIVENDLREMLEADTIIINPESFAIGTNIELGFCTAWKETSKLMKEILNRDLSDENKIKELEQLSNELDKEILPHIEDIRRHDLPEIGDRRSFSLNAFMYGCCLRTTDGKGLFEWEEILDEFKEC